MAAKPGRSSIASAPDTAVSWNSSTIAYPADLTKVTTLFLRNGTAATMMRKALYGTSVRRGSGRSARAWRTGPFGPFAAVWFGDGTGAARQERPLEIPPNTTTITVMPFWAGRSRPLGPRSSHRGGSAVRSTSDRVPACGSPPAPRSDQTRSGPEIVPAAILGDQHVGLLRPPAAALVRKNR